MDDPKKRIRLRFHQSSDPAELKKQLPKQLLEKARLSPTGDDFDVSQPELGKHQTRWLRFLVNTAYNGKDYGPGLPAGDGAEVDCAWAERFLKTGRVIDVTAITMLREKFTDFSKEDRGFYLVLLANDIAQYGEPLDPKEYLSLETIIKPKDLPTDVSNPANLDRNDPVFDLVQKLDFTESLTLEQATKKIANELVKQHYKKNKPKIKDDSIRTRVDEAMRSVDRKPKPRDEQNSTWRQLRFCLSAKYPARFFLKG